jgi:sialic acid synthase SpsE
MESGECIKLGGLNVGAGFPPLFMAEIGTFFNQDMDKAEILLNTVTKGGADLFKTEILHTTDVCLKDTGLIHTYNHAQGIHKENYRSLIERKVVPLRNYSRLFSLCRQQKMPFVASVYDLEGIAFLMSEGGAGIKISRDNVNNVPLLEGAGKTGLPVIMDVSGHHLEEVARAVRLLRESGAGGVILNHHPGRNPAPYAVHNLRILETYRRIFRLPVGLSCHFRGEEMMYLSVALGASMIEKGVFDNPDAVEQDIVSALAVTEIERVVRKIKDCWSALGDGEIRAADTRDESSWKGLIALKDIQKGDLLDTGNVSFAFPPMGISVGNWDLVRGKKALKDMKKNDVIDWNKVAL